MPEQDVTVAEIERFIDTEAATWRGVAGTSGSDEAIYAGGRTDGLESVASFIRAVRDSRGGDGS